MGPDNGSARPGMIDWMRFRPTIVASMANNEEYTAYPLVSY